MATVVELAIAVVVLDVGRPARAQRAVAGRLALGPPWPSGSPVPDVGVGVLDQQGAAPAAAAARRAAAASAAARPLAGRRRRRAQPLERRREVDVLRHRVDCATAPARPGRRRPAARGCRCRTPSACPRQAVLAEVVAVVGAEDEVGVAARRRRARSRRGAGRSSRRPPARIARACGTSASMTRDLARLQRAAGRAASAAASAGRRVERARRAAPAGAGKASGGAAPAWTACAARRSRLEHERPAGRRDRRMNALPRRASTSVR